MARGILIDAVSEGETTLRWPVVRFDTFLNDPASQNGSANASLHAASFDRNVPIGC